MSLKRRQLLRAGSLVLLVGAHQIVRGATVVAVRLWPAPDYTRLTIESDGLLTSKLWQNAERLVLDIDGLELDPTLRELVAKVRPDDPYIAAIRLAPQGANGVRLNLDLKQPAVPQLFNLSPVAAYKHRLVVDLYTPKPEDPLEALIAERMKEKPRAIAPAPVTSPDPTIELQVRLIMPAKPLLVLSFQIVFK